MKRSTLLLLTALAVVAAACGGKQAEQPVADRVELVETTTLAMSEISRELEFSTTLEGWQTVNIAPSITGKIEHIYVEVGTTVGAGTTI